MYSKFYTPNILATGSSEIDQSSYSHHADNDVGVAVIDRYTYYNLEFLESRVTSPTSKLTMGELFDSYDPAKIHSDAGIRYDLFEGGEEGARSRRVMDFFGNVQNVELQAEGRNETQWREELEAIDAMIADARRRHNESLSARPGAQHVVEEAQPVQSVRREGAVKVDEEQGWNKQIVGAAALLGCAGVWLAGSLLESM
jgi:glycosylphosphatidylinositol transamidase (GPIT) subunit GPI8|tara:strand:+ start:42885 stop:43481 length:597 start_codon:yes stop_codon:yes gene_type:complete